MARKKTSKQIATSPREFSSSPFKKLEGLSALAEQKPRSQRCADAPAKSKTEDPANSSGDFQSFAEEMHFLGVEPLLERVVRESSADQNTEKDATLLSGSPEKNERAVFLDAVGSMEKVFKDEWSEDESLKQASPRRMKLVERGLLNPEAELELHGLTVDEAAAKVTFFLQNAAYQGFQTLLIITGKGLHSDDGPVLRRAVETLLNQQREHVLEWGLAPRRHGGDGALVVFLRQVVAE